MFKEYVDITDKKILDVKRAKIDLLEDDEIFVLVKNTNNYWISNYGRLIHIRINQQLNIFQKKALGRGLEQLFSTEVLDFNTFEDNIMESAKELTEKGLVRVLE